MLKIQIVILHYYFYLYITSTTTACKLPTLPCRGATTAKKLRGIKVWVPTSGRLPKAGLGVGCGGGRPFAL